MSTATERARRDEAVNRAYTVQVVEGSKVRLSVGPAAGTGEATKGPPIGRRQDGRIRPWCHHPGSLHMADFPVSAADGITVLNSTHTRCSSCMTGVRPFRSRHFLLPSVSLSGECATYPSTFSCLPSRDGWSSDRRRQCPSVSRSRTSAV